MRTWKITEPKKIEMFEDTEPADLPEGCARIKLTRSLLSNYDAGMFTGAYNNNYPIVPGRHGVGIISQVGENDSGFSKGQHVVIDTKYACDECKKCLSGSTSECTNMNLMGINSDGILADFVTVKLSQLIALPPHIKDDEAIFAQNLALALKIFNTLDVKKGEYLAIIGSSICALAVAHIAQYYQAIPILIDGKQSALDKAKDSGISYTINPTTENIQDRILQITSDIACKNIAYLVSSNFPLQKVFEFASVGGNIAISGWDIVRETANISFSSILKKRLTLIGVNNSARLLQSAVNLIANKATELSGLVDTIIPFDEADSALQKISEHIISSAIIKF